MRGVCLMFTVLGAVVLAEHPADPIDKILGERNLGADYSERDGYLTPEEKAKYGKILNFAFDMKKTPVGQYLNGAKLPSLKRLQGFSVPGMLESLQNDAQFREKARDLFFAYYHQRTATKISVRFALYIIWIYYTILTGKFEAFFAFREKTCCYQKIFH